jgi:hypothetical protein
MLTSVVILFTGCNLADSIVDKTLSDASKQINEQCPMKVDSETRLDNTEALAGKIFQYNYTLVNYSKDKLTEEQINELQNIAKTELLKTIKTNSSLKALRDVDTTFIYVYKSNDGHEIMSLTFAPQDYK